MNAHRHAKLTPVSRAEMVRRVVEFHRPVEEVAAGFGLSVRSARKWLARFRAGGIAGLQDRSSRPKLSPSALHPLRVASAVSFLHASLDFFQKLGVQTRRVYSDNGACYRAGSMRDAVSALGLKHRFTRPYTPKTNGKAERFIQASLRSWAYAHAYSRSNQRAERLPAFLHNCNWHRPHHSLSLLPPVSRLRLPLNNLLPLHS